MNKIQIVNIAIFLTLVSCQLLPETATVNIVVSPQPTLDINKIIVDTAEAAQTLTATFAPSATATINPSLTPPTPTPTQTFIFILQEPTLSEEEQLTAISDFLGSDESTPKPIPYTGRPWTCAGDGKYPPNGGLVTPGKPFIATWTVINTGTKDWSVNAIDFVYKSGYRHEGKRIQDLSKSVKPGQKVTWFVDFIAPKVSGIYTSTWIIKVGSQQMCGINFVFEVIGKE